MRPQGRVAAAIEVLAEIETRHRPASVALADWGKANRFAGSGDRSAIGNLVFDALRRRASAAHMMGSDTPRAGILGALRLAGGLGSPEIAALADGTQHAPAALSEAERAALDAGLSPEAPAHVRADVPEWLWPRFVEAFGDRAVEEGRALARRAPVDLRANTLKTTREKLLAALGHLGAVPTPLAPCGVRIPAPVGGARAPNVEAEAAHGKGWFEVQDEGSQLAALLAGARARMQVLDLCAGAGGKTLAMAAAMGNSGQIYAYDGDKTRLRPIFERIRRAGARNIQVMTAGDETAVRALGPRFDVVLVDAPCTGTGVWRRRPDSKWRLKAHGLAERVAEQQAVLALAAPLVKPGGRLVYVTCSILPEENAAAMAWLRAQHPEMEPLDLARMWTQSGLPGTAPASADGARQSLLLTPASHGTDGFFVAGHVRRAAAPEKT